MNSNNGMQNSGMVNSTQNSYKNGFDGDIQKAKQYNQQVGTQGVGSMNSSAGSSNGSIQ